MHTLPDIPNLRHLRMVQAIGISGGVSSAARALSTSQPAVTQAVANIEADIGSPIFERSASGTYPTEVGRKYLIRVDRFFEILENAILETFKAANVRHRIESPRVDRMITVTQIRSLIAMAQEEYIDEIAENLGLSPISLFRSARSLEKVLGFPIFDRTAQGSIANKTAKFLAREFRKAIREIEFARGEILLMAGVESLEIVVGAMPMACSHKIAISTHQFMLEYPNVKVRLVGGEYNKLLTDLVNGRVDIIFGILRKPDWAEDVEEEFLFNDSYCVVVRPGHPLISQKNVKPDELAGFDWIVPKRRTPRRDRIEDIFATTGKSPNFHVETSSLTMSRALIMTSDTITLMTKSEVQPDLNLGNLAQLNCDFLESHLVKGLTTRANWLPTEAHLHFLSCLRAAASETEDTDKRLLARNG